MVAVHEGIEMNRQQRTMIGPFGFNQNADAHTAITMNR